MPSQRLSTELDWSTDENSVIDVPTAVETWDVPDGGEVTLREKLVAIADFMTTAGNGGPAGGNADPSRSTKLALAYREPGDPLDHWTVFTHELGIAAFNDLSLKDQQSGENAQNRRFSFDPEEVQGSRIGLSDADDLALLAHGPDEIDGSASQFSYPMDFNQG
jgi:hypothetical protein